ncbi:MAG: hypothetical protein R3F17_01130, partial [Planctomycetota bacterium]
MARAARKTEAPPQDQVRNLLAGLKSGELPPAVVLKGDERYFLDQATSGLIQAGETRGLEICRFDGSDPEFQVGALIGDLLGGALFASARLFVLRSLETMLKSGGRGDALGEAILARL